MAKKAKKAKKRSEEDRKKRGLQEEEVTLAL